jgi:CheY-like chemotaxis protein
MTNTAAQSARSVPVKLLIVDDNEAVRLALARALNRTGVFAAETAANGRDALERLAHADHDAVLTDLHMSDMDGLELVAHLVERNYRGAVAVMTGYRVSKGLAARLQEYGIVEVFTKPIDLSFLLERLQQIVAPTTVDHVTGITPFGFLQLFELERKTGLIVVSAAHETGRLHFSDGQLVHAEAGLVSGLAALVEILGWPDPTLEVFYGRSTDERTITRPLQHVLMEAARLLDEGGGAGKN